VLSNLQSESLHFEQRNVPIARHDYYALMMLYSCLVDADAIDTSAHAGDRIAIPQMLGMEDLQDKLLMLNVNVKSSAEVQRMRSEVRNACLVSAPSKKGFFSLHAPTGSGKTISGALWAAGHGEAHGMSRIVYVAPYRTIIDQTADIYAGIFGEENVLAHHSTADFWTAKDAGRMQRQLAENWDVPVVVTTSEQFFESLHSARPGASRKLHNLVNSVVIIDEPQAIPLRLLTPCMASLKALVEQFGCSVLFMSATVPTLQNRRLLGDVQVQSILDKDFTAPQRVTVNIDRFKSCYWSDVSTFMLQHNQSLAISNTKKGALAIYKALGQNESGHLDARNVASRVSLSTWLCPSHRRVVVADIKERLLNGKPCHVSSTQVIEAGVDLDFPDVLLREKAPLDSLLQAFGRCNRNGNGMGQCYVFSPAEGNSLKDYDKAISVVNALLYEKKLDAFDPATLSEYFRMLYAISNLDVKEIMQNIEALNFETVRNGNEDTEQGGFRLIEDGQVHLIVEYGTAEQRKELRRAIEHIKVKVAAEDIPLRWATRYLQNYVVSVFPSTFNKLSKAFPLAVEELYLNYFVWSGDYSQRTGLGDVIDSLSGGQDEE
jgi:CRISPR-associated endonuclease/helicase Cas3